MVQPHFVDMSPQQRLSKLASALVASSSPAEPAAAAAGAAGAGAGAAAAAAAAAPARAQLLTLEQLKQFVRDGFIVLQLSDVPKDVHDAIYDTAYAIEGEAAEAQRADKGDGGGAVWLGGRKPAAGGLGVSVAQTQLAATRDAGASWDSLAPAFRQLLDSSVVRGAAATLCGEDFVASTPPTSPRPIGIVDRTLDQQWHKDMTGMGIREHCPRSISAWYYPCEVSLEMGPTCILPGSHLCGRDRLGCPHSEDRFDADMDPAGKTLAGWKAGADQAIYLRGDHSARQGRLSGGQALLGDHSISERVMTVPAGSIVLKHDDIVHRRSRAQDGSKYRPMFGLGSFRRSSEPEPGHCWLASATSTAAAVEGTGDSHLTSCLNPTEWSERDLCPSSPKAAVWECLINWHLGHGCTMTAATRDSPSAPTDLELAQQLLHSDSEVERIGSAYTLAARGEVGTLAEALCAGRECTRRAACWGFGAAGPAAIAALTPLLSRPPNEQEVVIHAANALGHVLFSQTYSRILTLILQINNVPCCWTGRGQRQRPGAGRLRTPGSRPVRRHP